SSCYTQPVEVEITTSIHDQILTGVSVYPNPFDSNVLVELQLDQTDDIRLEVVNLQGKLIYSLEKINIPAGIHQITWNAPSNLAQGLYMLNLRTKNGFYNQKLLKR
ncbi:MAG: T9SS type A sorting domain-containing protein, partial [Bacteroidetes bacterium]|nr:T9SS type A sorting domain-containing protein [Bacteroidota bacterium]